MTVNEVMVDTDFSVRRVEEIGLDDVTRAREQIERHEAGPARFVVTPDRHFWTN